MLSSKTSIVSLLALGLTACGPGLNGAGGPGGTDPATADMDQDGLPDAWEDANDLDSTNADSDGDGFTDSEEVFGYSDPLDENSRLYQGGWDRNPWPADLEDNEVGYAVDAVAPNFALPDSYGDGIDLWSFYGNVILIKNSAYWCGPCRASEEEAEARYNNFADQGFIQITLLAEDRGSSTPTQEVLAEWRDEFGVSFPVVGDEAWAVSNGYEQDGGIPTFSLIGRDMTIRTLDVGHGDGLIQQLLDEEVPEVEWDLPGDGQVVDEAPEGGEGEDGEAVETPEVPAVTGYTPFGGTGNAEAADADVPAPYGGAACNAGGSNAGSLALLFGLLGLAGVRRR